MSNKLPTDETDAPDAAAAEQIDIHIRTKALEAALHDPQPGKAPRQRIGTAMEYEHYLRTGNFKPLEG